MCDFYVYSYQRPTGEFIYIGKGKENRAYWHLYGKGKHHFANSLRKILREGVQPIINIFPCDSEEQANTVEIYAIHVIGRLDLAKGTLLNLTDGGDGSSGHKHSTRTKEKIKAWHTQNSLSDEAKQKIREAHIGKPSWNAGKHWTESTKRKMKLSALGKPKSKEHIENNRAAQKRVWAQRKSAQLAALNT